MNSGHGLDPSIWTRPLQFGFRERLPPKPLPAPAEMPRSTPATVHTPIHVDLGLRLVGTVIEEGRSTLIAIDRLGKLDFRKQGDTLELEPNGVHIESIANGSARVTYQGQSLDWYLGQSLSVAPSGASIPQQPTPPSMLPTPRTKMSVEEELEMINRVPGTDPT
jgi:hypothetical protein